MVNLFPELLTQGGAKLDQFSHVKLRTAAVPDFKNCETPGERPVEIQYRVILTTPLRETSSRA